MHYHAEYGSASHWRYKDVMKLQLLRAQQKAAEAPGAEADDAPAQPDVPSHLLPPTQGPPLTREDYHARVKPGQAVRIVDEGRMLDGVVLDVLEDYSAVLVASTLDRRWRTAEHAVGPLHAAAYDDMYAHALARGWHTANMRDDVMQARSSALSLALVFAEAVYASSAGPWRQGRGHALVAV